MARDAGCRVIEFAAETIAELEMIGFPFSARSRMRGESGARALPVFGR